MNGVLMARIDRLPEAPRRVLQYASVRAASSPCACSMPSGMGLPAAAGRALKRLYADVPVEVFDRIAHQSSQPDDGVRAVEYLTRVAKKAARVYANADAARVLEQAIDHVRICQRKTETCAR